MTTQPINPLLNRMAQPKLTGSAADERMQTYLDRYNQIERNHGTRNHWIIVGEASNRSFACIEG